MSITTNFQASLKTFFSKANQELSDFAHFFLPKLGHAVEVAFEDLAIVAGQSVLEQAPKVLSGDVKFANAVNTVLHAVSASGKKVAIETARAAVQLAFLEAQKIVSNK